MIHLAILAWAGLNAMFAAARSPVRVGRFLLVLVAFELLTMPITQGIWTWDRFLHGGQDFELSLLITITCLCLILLRAEQSRRSLGLLVLIRAPFLNARKRAASTLFSPNPPAGQLHRIPGSLTALRLDLPLLI